MYKYKISIYVFVVIIFFSFDFFTKDALAVTLSPVRFELSGDPGETVSEKILLINETKNPETFFSSYMNFEAQGDTGNPAFVEPIDDLGTWIETAESSVTILPGQQVLVPFTITIPKDAEPGGHFAVVFFGTLPPQKENQLGIGTKTGVLVLLSVNGEVKRSAGINNFGTINKQFWYNTLPVSFEYVFRNDGGDRIKPEGEINIRNTIFLSTERLDANKVVGNILPSSARKFKIDWLKYEHPKDYLAPTGFFSKYWNDVIYQWRNFAVGYYRAELSLAYDGASEPAEAKTSFFVFPWQLLLVSLVVLSLVVFLGRKIIRGYNSHIITQAQKSLNLNQNNNQSTQSFNSVSNKQKK